MYVPESKNCFNSAFSVLGVYWKQGSNDKSGGRFFLATTLHWRVYRKHVWFNCEKDA